MSSTPQRIAVIKPCCIGDCVMALPALDALLNAFPDAALDVYAGRHSAAVFQGRAGVRQVCETPDLLTARDVRPLSARLRRGRYQSVALLDRSRWLRLAAGLAGASRPLRVRDPRQGFRHEGDLYLDALAPLGIVQADTLPRLQLSAEDRAAVDELLDGVVQACACGEHGRGTASPLQREAGSGRGEAMPRPFRSPPIAVIHPGGAVNPGALMLQKRWPADRHAELARWLRERGLLVLLSGGQDEVELAARIAALAELPPEANVAGRLTLMQVAALVEQAALYVGADTGVSHLAAASGTPSVVIFGPTNPLRYGPRGARVALVAPAESYQIADIDLRKAPTVARSVATKRVSVDEVLVACDGLLEPAGRS